MNSKEIHEFDVSVSQDGLQPCMELAITFLREIAAQLAELNEKLMIVLSPPMICNNEDMVRSDLMESVNGMLSTVKLGGQVK